MRLILIILIAVIAIAAYLGHKHGCQFGLNKATVNCILHGAPAAPAPAEAPAPAPAPAPQ